MLDFLSSASRITPSMASSSLRSLKLSLRLHSLPESCLRTIFIGSTSFMQLEIILAKHQNPSLLLSVPANRPADPAHPPRRAPSRRLLPRRRPRREHHHRRQRSPVSFSWNNLTIRLHLCLAIYFKIKIYFLMNVVLAPHCYQFAFELYASSAKKEAS